MTNGQTLSVLVVEHDLRVVRQLQDQLEQRGIGSVPVSSPCDVADRIQTEKFDGIFFNWNHPGLDGDGLSHMIRNSPSNRDVPVVCMAPRRRADLLAMAGDHQVPFFLLKPFTDIDLSRLLDNCRPVLEEEHSRYQRLPVRVPLLCAWHGGESTGETVNVSSTGLLLRLATIPGTGSRVSLHVDIPGEDWQLRMEGIVARTRGNEEVGVRFNRPSRRGLNPLLRQAHALRRRDEEQVCGIERRSHTVPGPAGSSLGSGAHPHRTPKSSPPDPVLLLVADKDPQVREALTSVLGPGGGRAEFVASVSRAARRFKEEENQILIVGISQDTAEDFLISLGVDEVNGQARRRVLCLLPHRAETGLRREIARRGLRYLVKPVPFPALLQALRIALRETGVKTEREVPRFEIGEPVADDDSVQRFDPDRSVHCFL